MSSGNVKNPCSVYPAQIGQDIKGLQGPLSELFPSLFGAGFSCESGAQQDVEHSLSVLKSIISVTGAIFSEKIKKDSRIAKNLIVAKLLKNYVKM